MRKTHASSGVRGDFIEGAFDAQGRVTAMVLRGIAGEGDTLAEPTVKYTYELGPYEGNKRPARVKVKMR